MAREETTGGVAYAGEELKLESRKPKSPDARRSRALTHWRGPLTPDVDLDDLIEGDAILAGSVSAAKSFGSAATWSAIWGGRDALGTSISLPPL